MAIGIGARGARSINFANALHGNDRRPVCLGTLLWRHQLVVSENTLMLLSTTREQ